MKEEIRNTENAEKKGRRILNDEALEQVSGGSSRFDLQQEIDTKIFDVMKPDSGLVEDNEDLELNKLVDSPWVSFHTL